MPKYKDETLLKVSYAIAIVIVSVIAGISFCLTKVMKSIT